ncbi:MSMEG_4193 family putative phosphomutase [Luteococcus japonicus]|uniref:Phosphoglycerate mutase n=1 Tax=Luteococcus japonicus LSP_Lj1 TaxID=1255658 RepID=A0A1R4JE83_9ACTN|nr:MSMEG_4193 family putative phosphomutase [Luteococcus japonicus]SJN30347.1 Phosphoglycerate mutase [Luteococcus japonicus LSP_Lj1]
MSLVVLVRHGRSTSNTAGTLSGRSPGITLDARGESQAMAVGERLRGVPLAAAVRSPMLRCEQTLGLALSSAGITPPVHVDDRLTECDYGRWTGRSLAELTQESLWQQVQEHPSMVVFPEGESMTAMAGRTVAAVQDWNARLAVPQGEPEPVWLLVSHGDPIKAVLSHALGQQLDDFQRIVVDPASISLVRFPPPGGQGMPTVIAMNTSAGQITDRLAGAGHGPQLGGGLGSQADNGNTT